MTTVIFRFLFVYDYTVKMASMWLYCENVKSEYMFFSCPAKLFSSRFRIKIIFRKKNIKLKLVYCFTSVRPSVQNIFVTFFSATIDGRNLIFGHKLHIGSAGIIFFLQNFVYDYTVKMSSRNIFFSPVQPKFFLQDSESKYLFRKK
jgi:hypothetical protein